MDALTLSALLTTCAPLVHAATADAVIAVESNHSPHAIGVDGGALIRQPATLQEAVATVRALKQQGWNFSAGLAQINVRNFDRLGLTFESAFDPCSNLQAMQTILLGCLDRAQATTASTENALRRALSCYYSGNFTTGFTHGYVRKVVTAAAGSTSAAASIPTIRPPKNE